MKLGLATASPSDSEESMYGAFLECRGLRNYLLIDSQIVLSHSAGGKRCSKASRMLRATFSSLGRRLARPLRHFYDDPADSIIDDFGDGSVAKRDRRCPTGHRFDHVQTEWLGPIDRRQTGHGIAEKTCLSIIANLPNEFYVGIAKQWFNASFEILAIYPIHLRCNLQSASWPLPQLQSRDQGASPAKFFQ